MDFTAIDTLTPFMLEGSAVRGRLVRLSNVATTVLGRYDYPDALARLLGELLLVASMLASNLKQEGVFTVQVRGNGLVPLLVVDAVHGGELRGFAEIPETSRAAIAALGERPSLAAMFGDDAYLAVTLDPGEGMQRYQGVVALEGDSMAQAIAHYFTHSQQLDILFKLAVVRNGSQWVAGGLMVERLPPEHSTEESREALAEHWRYATAIAETLKPDELTDTLLEGATLLYQLYHEAGVWVQDVQALTTGCRCSRERITRLLMSMPIADRADMVERGRVSVHCQFCNRTEYFTPAELGLATD